MSVDAFLPPHLDETGQPCTVHPAPRPEALCALALVGSRSPGFHHDLASKLQGLMMAIDELGEGLADNPDLARAAEAAATTLKEINTLLNAGRALTKPSVRTRVALRELIARASERVYVKLLAEIPDVFVEVAAPALIHGLSLAFDVAGGPGRGRSIPATVAVEAGAVTLRLEASPTSPASAPEALVLASFAVTREHGELQCAGSGAHLIVRLPLVA